MYYYYYYYCLKCVLMRATCEREIFKLFQVTKCKGFYFFKLEKNTKRKVLKLNIFYLVEKIERFHVVQTANQDDIGSSIYCTFHKHASSKVQKPTDDCVFRCCQSSYDGPLENSWGGGGGGGGRSTKKYSRKGKLNEKNCCTPINPTKYSCYGLKKFTQGIR